MMQAHLIVMPGLVPGIHGNGTTCHAIRGWPEQARPRRAV